MAKKVIFSSECKVDVPRLRVHTRPLPLFPHFSEESLISIRYLHIFFSISCVFSCSLSIESNFSYCSSFISTTNLLTILCILSNFLICFSLCRDRTTSVFSSLGLAIVAIVSVIILFIYLKGIFILLSFLSESLNIIFTCFSSEKLYVLSLLDFLLLMHLSFI